MQKKIIKFVIYILIFAAIVYQFGVPKYVNINAHEDSIKLYESISNDTLKWQTAGYSTNGNTIYFLEIGNSDDITLILGGIHGHEFGAFNLALRFARFINSNHQLINKKVIIIPTINPDGLINNTRKNANEVDINRNFPSSDWTPVYTKTELYPGRSPASEVETKIILDMLSKFKPGKIISIHTMEHRISYDGPAKRLANEISRLNGYKVTSETKYDINGSLRTYTGNDLGLQSITLELPDYNPEESWLNNKDALISAVNF